MVELTENINYLQPTGFKIVLDRKFYPNLTFFATSVVHPSTVMSTAILPRPRTDVRMAGDNLTFGELQCNLILDEDMNAFTEMFDWMENIVNTERTLASQRTLDTRTTECDLSVMVLNSKNNVTKELKYLDAVPTTLGDVSFDAAGGDQFITVPVTFAFTAFEVK